MTNQKHLLIFILTLGVFGILNTEMGVIGILPSLAEHFDVSISQAGWLVSLFAIGVAVSGPTMPLLFSGINRKKVMLLVLGVFVAGNVVSVWAPTFTVALLARVIPAFFHPVYCSLAFTVAANSVTEEEAPKAVSKVFIGVSAGMVVGVPIASFMASAFSLQMAMIFFAVVNGMVFLATLLFVPSMPVEGRLSYGAQLSIVKKPITWISAAAVLLLNSAVFGVYSYFAEYLKAVTHMSPNPISFLLFLYGGANMVGNVLAGKLLTKHAIKWVGSFPFALGGVYLALFLLGPFSQPMVVITLIWGILAGMGGNLNQYLMTSAAPEAPDFANGLFLSSTNVGTTLGAAAGGFFITGMGTSYVVIAGFLSILLSFAVLTLRKDRFAPTRKLPG
ncbi:MFS transporter [Paenibacillus aurantius]|uniref:MFS transporter n=1 Tax=Paenibacillus aurantius TaxID=2918900 RepID=A0AA96LFV1_9BACL|nr:MFS transporter [Paenibacillus aurantius]WNQ12503.1 MFS transporter [Paenibacillus aurantius]